MENLFSPVALQSVAINRVGAPFSRRAIACSKDVLPVLLLANGRPERRIQMCLRSPGPSTTGMALYTMRSKSHTGEHDNRPKHQLRPHPPLPVFEA